MSDIINTLCCVFSASTQISLGWLEADLWKPNRPAYFLAGFGVLMYAFLFLTYANGDVREDGDDSTRQPTCRRSFLSTLTYYNLFARRTPCGNTKSHKPINRCKNRRKFNFSLSRQKKIRLAVSRSVSFYFSSLKTHQCYSLYLYVVTYSVCE